MEQEYEYAPYDEYYPDLNPQEQFKLNDSYQQFDAQSAQNVQGTPQIETQKITYNKQDLQYKNFPKQIGNYFIKWIKKLKELNKIDNIPDGIDKLIQQKNKGKQCNFKIVDLKESCDDPLSQQLFQQFLSEELFLYLVHSNKVQDPYQCIPGISNYYSASKEPSKMKSNYLSRNQFISHQK